MSRAREGCASEFPAPGSSPHRDDGPPPRPRPDEDPATDAPSGNHSEDDYLAAVQGSLDEWETKGDQTAWRDL